MPGPLRIPWNKYQPVRVSIAVGACCKCLQEPGQAPIIPEDIIPISINAGCQGLAGCPSKAVPFQPHPLDTCEGHDGFRLQEQMHCFRLQEQLIYGLSHSIRCLRANSYHLYIEDLAISIYNYHKFIFQSLAQASIVSIALEPSAANTASALASIHLYI